MKERPILFSAPMVRAILDGSKTQTRRIVKPKWTIYPAADPRMTKWLPACPYGQPGDRLWVRETWQGPLLDSEEHEAQFREDGPDAFNKPGFCAYRATDTLDAVDLDGNDLGWRPSIHMPRWASRISLEITGVRVERLQDISEADAIAEGISAKEDGRYHCGCDDDGEILCKSPVTAYAWLWNSINGDGAWAANPWVWVVEFKRVAALPTVPPASTPPGSIWPNPGTSPAAPAASLSSCSAGRQMPAAGRWQLNQSCPCRAIYSEVRRNGQRQ